MPTAVTIANITVAAPPITGPGTLATTWPRARSDGVSFLPTVSETASMSSRRFGVGHQHDDAHRDDRRGLEPRMTEPEEPAEPGPLGGVHAGEVQQVHRPRHQRSDHDRQQYRDLADEPAEQLVITTMSSIT